MKEMIYSEFKKSDILATGKYNGIDYFVVSYGTHPCVYLGFPERHVFFGKHYDSLDVDCHGGLTFSGFKDFGGNKWLIGWDYAHCTDYTPFMAELTQGGYRWTTSELIQEAMGVIDENGLEVR